MQPKKILVIRDGRLGDMLLITPVLRALRRRWPESELHLLAGDYGARVLQHNPHLDRIHSYDRSSSLLSQFRGLRTLPGPFDLLVVLESSSHFAQIARAIPAQRRVGYSNVMDWLYDLHLDWDEDAHAIHNHLALARRVGVREEDGSPETELQVSSESLELADHFLRDQGLGVDETFAFLHPPCGLEDPLRPWPNFYYAELADRLQRDLGVRALINGSPEEAHIIDAVVAQTTTPVLINTDPSLDLMMGLIARSSLFVSGDTSPVHMASALQRPVLALYGPTQPRHSAPLGGESPRVILSANYPCSPCTDRDPPEKEKCARQGLADCMLAIQVDEVFESCRQLLTPV